MNSSQEQLSEEPKQRERTNVGALYFCIGFVIVLFCFVGYAFVYSDIDRLVKGYDDCGNICGMQNEKNTIKNCAANDKRNEPLTLVNITRNEINPNITDTHSMCVKSCADYPGFEQVINRCFLLKGNETSEPGAGFSSVLQTVSEDLIQSWHLILITCIVALVFSYILLVLFRYAIKYVIWFIFIGIVVAFFAGSIIMIVFFFAAKSSTILEEQEGAYGFLIASGLFALFGLIIGLVIYFFRKRIGLVVQIFKEASKVLADVPTLIAEPLLTFISLGFTFFAFIYFAIIIQTAGKLEVQNDAQGKFFKAEFQPDSVIAMSNYVNFIAFIWFTSFILGCQNFVIAGAVCQWFFTRTKSKLDSPLMRSFEYLLQFHIGSVCLGSVLITIMKIIKMIIENLKKSMNESENPAARMCSCCCDYIMEMLEEFLQYLVRNAYIVVAMDGTPLIQSGRKAFGLITKNLVDVIALNKVGDFVLFLGRVFVVLITGFVSYELIGKNKNIEIPAVPIILSVIFAFLIIHCFMTVYEMIVDSIFICFCEDCEKNNGLDRPYYMSKGMMEVMMELKQAAGGEFNFTNGQNVEAGGSMRPMIPPNYQFSK